MLPSSRCKSEAARFLRLAPWLGVTYSDLRAFLSIAAPWRGGRVAKAWTQIQGLQPLQPWRVPELERATLLLNDPAACAARPERSWPPPCPWSSSHRGRPALGARRPRPPSSAAASTSSAAATTAVGGGGARSQLGTAGSRRSLLARNQARRRARQALVERARSALPMEC